MPAPVDRYEPLPGLFGLPGFFWRKLSPAGRKVAAAVGVVLLVGAVAATIVLAPRISEAKRDHAAAERRARVSAAKRARARLIAEQRPRYGRLVSRQAAGPGGLIRPIERAITRDAQARATRGEVPNRARRTSCRSLGHRGGRLMLGCTAVTTETESTTKASGVVVGYSYRAAVSPRSGRFAFCKSSGKAIGFSAGDLPDVELPRACGG